MMFRKLIGPMALATTMMVLAPAMASAQDRVPAEKRLPPGVLAYATVPSGQNLAERLKNSSTGDLINDPAMAEFRDHVLEKISEGAQEAEEELGFPLSDLQALFAGEVAVAAVRPAGQTLGYAILAEVGDHKDIFDKVMEKVDSGINKENVETLKENIDDIEVTVYSFEIEAGDGKKIPSTFCWFLKDGTFVGGSSLRILESIVERWDGEHQMTFSDSLVYTAIMEKCEANQGEPVIKWYFEPIQLSLASMSLSPDLAMASAMASAYLPILGLNGLKGMGGTVEIATDKYDSISRTMIYADQPTTGVLKVFEFPSTISGPPAWVPSEAATYFSVNWNLPGAYRAVASMYDTFTGQPGGFDRMVDNATADAAGGDLNIKDDIVDAITGEVHGYFIPPTDGNPENIKGVFALKIASAEKAAKIMDLMTSDGEFEKETVRGREVLKNSNGNGIATYADGNLYFSSDIDRIEAAIAGKADKPLSANADFIAARAKAPAKLAMITYANATDGWKASYDAARNGDLDSATEGEIDFSLLPPFEDISKYFVSSISYAVGDENGAVIVQMGLKK